MKSKEPEVKYAAMKEPGTKPNLRKSVIDYEKEHKKTAVPPFFLFFLKSFYLLEHKR